ncbi:MAG: phosphatidate cytidylyltransferase [Fimbriimonadaceae bacterium]
MKQRVLTALVGIPIVLAACFYTQPWFFGIIALAAAVIGCYELGKLFDSQPPMLGAMLVPGFLLLKMSPGEASVAYAPILLGLWAIGVVSARKSGLWVHLASMWVGAPLAATVLLHQLNVKGTWQFSNYVLLALIPLWIGDSLAIFAGKAFGKHLLAPAISPKKTWEGAIANLAGCILGAFATGSLIGVSPPVAISCGLMSGTLGQAGDLFQSSIKRRVGAKDSGSILPGHGGILDRIDSILFTAIPIYLILTYASK